jgi:hypothetical protein
LKAARSCFFAAFLLIAQKIPKPKSKFNTGRRRRKGDAKDAEKRQKKNTKTKGEFRNAIFGIPSA